MPCYEEWMVRDYRLIQRQNEVILQYYDQWLESWEESGSIEFTGQDTLILIDDYSGMRVPMKRISEESFQKVLDQLDLTPQFE